MLDRESACNRVFSGPSLCSVRRRWSWASVRACSFVFKLAAAPRIDNVVTAALLPPQPDQLRRRHDRHDNGERATPLYYGLIAELIAAALLIAALTGLFVQRSKPWLVGVTMALVILTVAATVVIASLT